MSHQSAVVLRDVSFRYPTAQDFVFEGLALHFPPGFTGVIGANGAGKSTLLALLSGSLEPTSGIIHAPGDAVYCPQRTDAAPDGLLPLLEAWDAEAYELRERLGLRQDFAERWQTLSHGERKRAQIGAALWQRPAVLAVDEPTNHIDLDARRMLGAALARFEGTGVLVSHDRSLLDQLCQQCVWLEGGQATVHPGGYTAAAAQRAHAQETALRKRADAKREHHRLQREVHTRRAVAARAHRERSKRGLPIKDHDARDRKNLARVSGKDGQAGRLLRQLDGRAHQAAARLASASVRRTYATGIWPPGSLSPRPLLFESEAWVVRFAGGSRALHLPPLAIRRDDRIALTGPNGVGKSSLLRDLLERLAIEPARLVWLPQELTAAEGTAVLAEARSLGNDQLGLLMNAVSRLGSRPERLLQSEVPSPGESRKLLLALGIARTPHLIIMDEPTNHLDLPAIEALEEALAGCPCALLLVSHDQRFVETLTTTTWRLEGRDGDDSVLQVD